MDDNLLNPKKIGKKEILISKLKRRFLKHIWLARVGIIFAGLTTVILLYLVLSFIFSKLNLAIYSKVLINFIFTPQGQAKSFSGRTNVLILGKSGQGHDAPDLTDTLIFASIPHNKTSVVLVSLPRDIWIPALRAKLNSVYYWGNQKEEKGGVVLAKSVVEEVVGQPVHYGLTIDFSGFKDIVDTVGGIEVNVENAFIDKKYPIKGRENDPCNGDKEFSCRYETIDFKKGSQYMSGDVALKFVRSRNAEGPEGTDLARAARQEKVISAIKNKVLSRQVLLSPAKIKALLTAIDESTEGDIDINAAAILARRILQAKDMVSSYVLPEEFLENPPISPKYDNLYVFIPKSGNWDKVHNWMVENIFN